MTKIVFNNRKVYFLVKNIPEIEKGRILLVFGEGGKWKLPSKQDCKELGYKIKYCKNDLLEIKGKSFFYQGFYTKPCKKNNSNLKTTFSSKKQVEKMIINEEICFNHSFVLNNKLGLGLRVLGQGVSYENYFN